MKPWRGKGRGTASETACLDLISNPLQVLVHLVEDLGWGGKRNKEFRFSFQLAQARNLITHGMSHATDFCLMGPERLNYNEESSDRMYVMKVEPKGLKRVELSKDQLGSRLSRATHSSIWTWSRIRWTSRRQPPNLPTPR